MFIILMVCIFHWQWNETRDMDLYTENYLNQQIQSGNYKALSNISGNKKIFRLLSKSRRITISSSSDNQGSGNVAYFTARINRSKNFYGITLKVKSALFHKFSMKKIVSND